MAFSATLLRFAHCFGGTSRRSWTTCEEGTEAAWHRTAANDTAIDKYDTRMIDSDVEERN